MKYKWSIQLTSNICRTKSISFPDGDKMNSLCLGCTCGRRLGLSNPLKSDLQNGTCGKTGKPETHFLNISCKYYIMTNRCVWVWNW